MEELLKSILGKVDGIDSRIGNLENSVNELRNDVNELKRGQVELRHDVNELKSDVNELKSDVNELKSDVNELKQGQVELTQKYTELKQGQDELKLVLNANREATEKTYAELVAFRNETNEKFKHIERQNMFFDNDLSELSQKVVIHEREIKKLKYEVKS